MFYPYVQWQQLYGSLSTIRKAAAIVHKDKTSRVQTVNRDQNNTLFSIITEFERITDLPIILNTSLNINGDTIACKPEDAIYTFENSELDFLILDGFYIKK
jgi:carbamoyltransferase